MLDQGAELVNLTKAEQLYRKAQDGGAVHLVAEIDGAIVGFANVAPETNEISACYAAPNMARRGVGSVLLARMETIAHQAGCDHLTLRASLNAKGFYRAHGYVETGRGEHEFPSGARMAAAFTRKDFA